MRNAGNLFVELNKTLPTSILAICGSPLVEINDCLRSFAVRFDVSIRKMGSGKKHRKQRKHRASPVKSQISIRLEKLRNRRRHNLWSDDDDDGKRSTPSNVIVLSDSDKEEQSTRKRKSRSHTDKNATCLICSILFNLSSKNCCPEHLSRLKRHSHRLSKHVTIEESTDEIRQRDLDVQQASPMTVDFIESTSPPRTPLPPLASTIVIESTSRKSPEHPPPPIDDVRSQTTSDKPLHNPWTPISDEIIIDLEQVVDEDDPPPPVADSPLEFTPPTVRRTDTEIMAARLPKIPLKPGRFRHGRPISDPSTSNNGANAYRPLSSTTQSPPDIRPPSPPPPPQPQNSENPSDNVLTQDEPSTTIETTTNERTPSRISYRLNPDGTRVSISRPSLPTNAHSPLFNSLRRTSTDVTPFSKQM